MGIIFQFLLLKPDTSNHQISCDATEPYFQYLSMDQQAYGAAHVVFFNHVLVGGFNQPEYNH